MWVGLVVFSLSDVVLVAACSLTLKCERLRLFEFAIRTKRGKGHGLATWATEEKSMPLDESKMVQRRTMWSPKILKK